MHTSIGKVYGNWKIIAHLPGTGNKLCLCKCGTLKPVCYRDLRRGLSNSCGCLKKTLKDSQPIEVKLKYVFKGIKNRCRNSKDKQYHNYGGRGIKCHWNSTRGFIEDMKDGYKIGLQIDRIDVNGDYCKENCRWAKPKENSNNRRNNVTIEYNGQIKTLVQWCEELNLPYLKTYRSIKKGLMLEEIIRHI